MQTLEHFILNSGLIIGYIIIFSIVFAESGLFFGFFLPGDSLLFSLGLLTSQHQLSLLTLIIVSSVAAITGDQVGYWFGVKVGPALFNREESRFFKKAYLKKAHQFYQERGAGTIVLARFIPFVRTFAPIVAGIAKMKYSTFSVYNIIGGVSWVTLVLVLGRILGNTIPNIDKYILPIILLIVVVSVIPAILHLRSSQKDHA